MAKLNDTYTNLNGGTPGEAMRYMTGLPTATYNSEKMTDDDVWHHVNYALKHKYSMGAICLVSHFHMGNKHAYGVLGAVQLKGGASDG